MVPSGAIGPTGYRPRMVDLWLDAQLPQLPAFMLVGPRAAGKTTTAARRATTVVRLDQPAEAAAFAADPDAALRGLDEPVLLDEWQVVPGVLGALKRSIDADPSPARFLVTGSVRAPLEGETWPGTGRLTRSIVYPMTMRERLGRLDGGTFIDRVLSGEPQPDPAESFDLRDYLEAALTGGYPYPALQLPTGARQAWMQSYLHDLFSRDVPAMEASPTRRRDASRLRRYFEAYALNSAGTASDTTIYEAADIDRRTAVAYEGLLEDLFVVERVPAWRPNRLRRLVTAPKRYVVDPALLAAAAGVDVDGVLGDGDLLGRVIDTFVAAQLRPEVAVALAGPRMHHLRTKGGEREIDLVLEFGGGKVVAIEVKAAAAPTAHDARHLRWLRDELGERFVAGVVLHTGPRTFELDRSISAVPIASLWA